MNITTPLTNLNRNTTAARVSDHIYHKEATQRFIYSFHLWEQEMEFDLSEASEEWKQARTLRECRPQGVVRASARLLGSPEPIGVEAVSQSDSVCVMTVYAIQKYDRLQCEWVRPPRLLPHIGRQ